MEFIAHRINTLAQLAEVPTAYGVELDIRDQGGRLILQHDPFAPGEDFEAYLAQYRHGMLILNIKSERTELRVHELLKRHGVTDYFFLDSSFPMSFLLSSQGERKIALRFSEFEGVDTILAMKDRIEWVWVDCFTKLPLSRAVFEQFKAAGLKICLVSPELQGRPQEVETYRDLLAAQGIVLDAVCTKLPYIARWQEQASHTGNEEVV